MLPRQRGRQTAEIFQRIRTAGRIRNRGFLIGFARVIRLKDRHIVVAFAHDVGGAAQDTAPFGAGHRGPSSLRVPRGGDGFFHDLWRGGIDGRDDLARGRIDHLDRGAVGIFDIFAVDEMAGDGLRLHRSLFSVGPRPYGGAA